MTRAQIRVFLNTGMVVTGTILMILGIITSAFVAPYFGVAIGLGLCIALKGAWNLLYWFWRLSHQPSLRQPEPRPEPQPQQVPADDTLLRDVDAVLKRYDEWVASAPTPNT